MVVVMVYCARSSHSFHRVKRIRFIFFSRFYHFAKVESIWYTTARALHIHASIYDKRYVCINVIRLKYAGDAFYSRRCRRFRRRHLQKGTSTNQ